MNSPLKSLRVTLKELAGIKTESVIIQSADGSKKLSLAVSLNNDGSTNVMFLVYENDIPLIQTPNVQDAIIRYNAVPIKAEVTEGSSL